MYLYPLQSAVLALILLPVLPDKINTEDCGVNFNLTKATQYIVGGRTAGPRSWPWVCSVGFRGTRGTHRTRRTWNHRCGGTLITYRHLITAAHCVEPFKDDRIKVRCGEHDLQRNQRSNKAGQVRDISHYDVHPNYEDGSLNYDISLLVVKTVFDPSDFIRPICLGSEPLRDTKTEVLVVGWGEDRNRNSGAKLNMVKLQVQNRDFCTAKWASTLGFGAELFCATDQTLAGSGSCFGDSGGPVFQLVRFNQQESKSEQSFYSQIRYELQGLVSGDFEKCGDLHPDIFTSTSYAPIYNWIASKIGGDNIDNRENGDHAQDDDDSNQSGTEEEDCKNKYWSTILQTFFCKQKRKEQSQRV